VRVDGHGTGRHRAGTELLGSSRRGHIDDVEHAGVIGHECQVAGDVHVVCPEGGGNRRHLHRRRKRGDVDDLEPATTGGHEDVAPAHGEGPAEDVPVQLSLDDRVVPTPTSSTSTAQTCRQPPLPSTPESVLASRRRSSRSQPLAETLVDAGDPTRQPVSSTMRGTRPAGSPAGRARDHRAVYGRVRAHSELVPLVKPS